MKEYNGHRSWNSWNVSLWINNDSGLYDTAMYYCRNYSINWKCADRIAAMSARALRRDIPRYTPDGAVFNQLSVKLALLDMVEEIQELEA